MVICPACQITEWCETCKSCHVCGATNENGQKVTPPMSEELPTLFIKPTSAVSQKIKGIVALSTFGSGGIFTRPIRMIMNSASLKSKKSLLAALKPCAWPKLFCRPCPTIPRHGFVDSRVCQTAEDVIALLEETLAADPNGELMVMDLVDASHNMIWTPSLLTIGLGNDGATAGKNVTSIPLVGKNPLSANLLKAAGLQKNQDPYIELVVTDKTPYLTQLRGGPKVTSVEPDYIPLSLTIKKVVKTNGESLLEWEKTVSDMKPGTVVYHPGGGVTDHWFVHARLSGIPVFTTRKPKIGEEIQKQPNEAPPPTPESIIRGFFAAESVKLDQETAKAATHLLLIGLHHSSAMSGENGKWIGAAISLMLRLGSVALRGEARHRPGKGNKLSREAVYTRCFNKPIRYHRACLSRQALHFRYGPWSGSFGGKKWAACAYALEPLYRVFQALTKEPTAENVSALIKALNVAVNQVHNNGWWLNKFTDSGVTTTIPAGQISPIVSVGPLAYQIDQVYRKLTGADISARLQTWTTTAPFSISVLRLTKAVAKYVPGSSNVDLALHSRLLGKNTANISIPLSSIMGNIMQTLGTLKVRPENGSLIVECQSDGQPPIKLWTEPSLLKETP